MNQRLALENKLTPREQAIVRCIMLGMQNVAIAKELGTSIHNIKRMLVGICDKAGCSTRLELCVWAFGEPDLARNLYLEKQQMLLVDDPNKADAICGHAFIQSMSSKA